MKLRVAAVAVGLVLVAAACSSSSEPEAAPTTAAKAPVTTTAGDTPAEPSTTTAAPDDGESESTPEANGTATVVLANGESFEFSVLCNLEPGEAGGSEVLFTVASNEEPYGLGVIQFGKSSNPVLEGSGNIRVNDTVAYETAWVASRDIAVVTNSDFVLELDGSTVTGSGIFITGADEENRKLDAGVPGELVANCG